MATPYTSQNMYNPSDFGKDEVEQLRTFHLQMQDSRDYFLRLIKPRLDRAYKLYISYTGDRQTQIKKWQSNVFVPYTQAVVETMKPRILDARPEFNVQGRTQEDQLKAEKQQQLGDYYWELSKMDDVSENVVSSSLIYGTGFMQPYWKKDVRKLKFLETKDLSKKKYVWKSKEKVFYDAPAAEWVDNYTLMYDWHNIERESKQYWLRRLVLTEPEIRRRYPMADKERLILALHNPGGDLTDYAAIRTQTKQGHTLITKGQNIFANPAYGWGGDRYYMYGDPQLQMYEVFEWTRPFDDFYTVHVGGSWVPILKGGYMPIPYDVKEAMYIDVPYLKIPGEYEGYGIPAILENPQIMLNMIKNQRLDSATLSIHKMWIVNPLANINKEELITRPFGIIYSIDPNGVREVQFSDIKASSYKEEDLLKSDMRYSSGVDDFSMGIGGAASSATEVRHLRESTLERVRLYINHLGDGYAHLLRYWIDMTRQFMPKPMIIRILGDNGKEMFPLIERDDLMGLFDYRASVLPSIAGQMDVRKKQNMDLFQLLINLPFVDPRKLTQKVLSEGWRWSLDSISTSEEGAEGLTQDGMMAAEGEGPQVEPEMEAMLGGGQEMQAPQLQSTNISPEVLRSALSLMRRPGEQAGGVPSPFMQASSPINLLAGGPPPTAARMPLATSNPRGLSRGGKVNTNIPTSGRSSPETALLNRSFNVQR